MSNGVEKETGGAMFLDDDCLFKLERVAQLHRKRSFGECRPGYANGFFRNGRGINGLE